MLVSACRFTCSNSDSGNDGSRSISATSASASGRLARTVSIDAPSMLTDVAARRRSSASLSSARVRFCVPRESIALATEQALRAVRLCRLVAPAQAELRDDRSAARLLRHQRELHAGGQRAADDARLDVLRRRVERLARGHLACAGEALQDRRDVGRGRDLDPLRLVGGIEEAERAVRRPEVGGRDSLDVGAGHFAELFAVEVEEPPVADGDELGERERDRAGVGEQLFDVALELGRGRAPPLRRSPGPRRSLRARRAARRAPDPSARPCAPPRRSTPSPGSRVWRSAPKIDAALPVSTSALCSRPVGWVGQDLRRARRPRRSRDASPAACGTSRARAARRRRGAG